MIDNEITWSELTHYNEKQKIADEALKKYKYILYGGAMGGGKSYWLRWTLIKLLLRYYKQTKQKGIRVGLFCEDYPALKDRHMSKMEWELPKWLGTIKRGDNEYHLKDKWGAGVICLRNLDDPSKYASSEFAAIAVDELTKNDKRVFDNLRTRMRWKGISDTKFIAGTNPGGRGHGWVKKKWMDKEHEVAEKEAYLFYYIPATVYDNKQNLPDSYFTQLSGLPDEMRRAFLEGDWNLFEGQYFTEWRDNIHIIDPFEIPDTWRKFGGYDHGRAKPACFKWYALDYDGNIYVYKEYYVNKEDGSIRKEAQQIAEEVVKLNGDDKLEYVVADSAIFSKTGHGETIAEILKKNGIGKPGTNIPLLIPSHKDRIAGWAIMHQMLYWDEKVIPKLRYFRNCKDSIRTIPALVYDEHKAEDLNSNGEDHAADVDRYFLQTLRNKKTQPPKTYVERKVLEFKKKREGTLDNPFKIYDDL